jgi:hypothetical protein
MQNGDALQKKIKKQWVIETAWTVHAVHAKYGTACTIFERFERPWQPLKGIYISKSFMFPNCPTLTLQKIET